MHFDALRQREQRRRQQRLFAIASGALAGMVVTSGLATAALIACATAQRQTVIARREAETWARQTTAFLVDLFRISSIPARRAALLHRTRSARQGRHPGRDATHEPTADPGDADGYPRYGDLHGPRALRPGATIARDSDRQTARALPPGEHAELALSLSHVGDVRTLRAEYPGAESAYREAIMLAALAAG